MFLLGLATDIVVHQSSGEELKLSQNFIDGTLISTSFNLSLENVVHFDDLLVGICKIIFTSVAIRHRYGWSHWWRSNWKILEDHPFGSPKILVEAHESKIIIFDSAKNLVGFICI